MRQKQKNGEDTKAPSFSESEEELASIYDLNATRKLSFGNLLKPLRCVVYCGKELLLQEKRDVMGDFWAV